jgi:chromosome segregation protein
VSDPALQPKPGLRESVTALEERLNTVEGELRTLDGRADTHKQAAERAFSELSALRERIADAEQRLGTEHTAAGLKAVRERVGVTEDRLDEHRDILDGHAARLTTLETISDEDASQDEKINRLTDERYEAQELAAELRSRLVRAEQERNEWDCNASEFLNRAEQAEAERDEAFRQRDSAHEWVEHWRGEADRHETGRIEAEDRSIAADEARDRMLHARDEAIRQRDQTRAERDEMQESAAELRSRLVRAEQERNEWDGNASEFLNRAELAEADRDEQKARADDAETDSVRECARADDAERELEEASRELRTVWSINETLESQLNEARDERDRLAAGDADGAGEAITSRYRITRREANDEH